VLPVIDSWSNYCNHATTPAEQGLYDHLIHSVETQSPDEVIDRFRKLFIDAVGYSNLEVWKAVKEVVSADFVDREFKFILNRSCYILINRWLMQPRLHPYIPELISLFETTPVGIAHSRTAKRMRSLTQTFVQSEQYLALKRLVQIMNETAAAQHENGTMLLGNLIRRYPCLYEHSLLTEDSSDEQRRRILGLRSQAMRQFELDLSQYVTHQHRHRLRQCMDDAPSAETGVNVGLLVLPTVQNPTLLSDRQLSDALQQFAGKVDGSNTHRDLANQFLTYSRWSRCYRSFKQELYEYLISVIDPNYGKHHFNQQLCQYLKDTLSHCDYQEVNDFLVVETCKKLLNFLVVESPQRPNHSRFIDLTGNIGILLTISLLLRIVLLCRAVRPWLEKRFSILFKLHEDTTTDRVNWLVEALEHLNIALSTNFGTIKLCY
jgi:hypothetical protein